MPEPNPLIEIFGKHPADFSFGLMGVPMALAAANVARPVAMLQLEHVLESIVLLVALSIQFSVAMLLSVYALDQVLTIWKPAKGRLLFLMVGMGIFALLLVIISVVPPSTPPLFGVIGFIQGLVFVCMWLLILLCGAFAPILKEHLVPLVISLAVAVVVVVMGTII